MKYICYTVIVACAAAIFAGGVALVFGVDVPDKAFATFSMLGAAAVGCLGILSVGE